MKAFNPTMVWFYQDVVDLEDEEGDELSIPLWSDFICHTSKSDKSISYSPFQSHYGLILSVIEKQTYCEECLLSIPLWSDFISKSSFATSLTLYTFQSHYGLILSCWKLRKLWNRSCFQSHYGLILSIAPYWIDKILAILSIPLWSDFIKSTGFSGSILETSFQSHYGLILSSPMFP